MLFTQSAYVVLLTLLFGQPAQLGSVALHARQAGNALCFKPGEPNKGELSPSLGIKSITLFLLSDAAVHWTVHGYDQGQPATINRLRSKEANSPHGLIPFPHHSRRRTDMKSFTRSWRDASQYDNPKKMIIINPASLLRGTGLPIPFPESLLRQNDNTSPISNRMQTNFLPQSLKSAPLDGLRHAVGVHAGSERQAQLVGVLKCRPCALSRRRTHGVSSCTQVSTPMTRPRHIFPSPRLAPPESRLRGASGRGPHHPP